MSQSLATSGIGEIAGQPRVIVTYTEPVYARINVNDGAAAQDEIPGFLYVGGHVKYEIDRMGNIVARNASGGESP